MKNRINYKFYLNLLEKILFLILLFVVIIIASGYKYDPNKKELIQTGVLKIENLEDNTSLKFNNSSYDNKNNISISLLEQNKYSLQISKKNRKDYLTNININEGEVTYINPVLLPIALKPNLINSNINKITYNNDSVFYTYIQNGLTYIERSNLNKALFSVDLNKSKIDITQVLGKESIDSIKLASSDNFILVTTQSKNLLLDFSKLQVTDITELLPKGEITSLNTIDDNLLIQYPTSLFVFNISDTSKIQKYNIFNGNDFLYTVDENKIIDIVYKNNTDEVVSESYSLIGASIQKVTFKNNFKLLPSAQLLYFYKNLYIYQGSILYKIVGDEIVDFQTNVKKTKIIDRYNMIIVLNEKAIILSKERQINYSFNGDLKLDDLQLMPDLFTFAYVDINNSLHLADFGGQDNILVDNIDPQILVTQSGSDTYILYSTKNALNEIRLGNDK